MIPLLLFQIGNQSAVDESALSSDGAGAASLVGASLASGAINGIGSSVVAFVGGGSSATGITRDGWLPREVIERERRRHDDDEAVMIIVMLDHEWREAA